MEFIAFDLETTGTVAGVDKIVEIGAVKFRNGEIDSLFATLVNPQRSIPAGASKVNKIYDHMVEGKPLIEDLLEPFSEFCGDLPLVAHNAPFDTQFLIADFKRYEMPTPSGVILDTLPISKKVIPGLVNYKLGTLIQHFQISQGELHRAEEDAACCGQVFLKLVQKVFGHNALNLDQLVRLTGRPETRFPKFEKTFKQLSFI